MNGEVVHTLHHTLCPVIMTAPGLELKSKQPADLCCECAAESQQMARLVSAMIGTLWQHGRLNKTDTGEDVLGQETNRQTDRQADRQAGRQAGRQTDRQTLTHMHSCIHSFTDPSIHPHTHSDRQHGLSSKVRYIWSSAAACKGCRRQGHLLKSPGASAAMHSKRSVVKDDSSSPAQPAR